MEQYSHRSKINRINKLLWKSPAVIKRDFQWDDEALWSMTHFEIGHELCAKLLEIAGPDITITDATACVGGSTIPFAKKFRLIQAVECNDGRHKMLGANINLFDLKNVKTYHAEYQTIMHTLAQDVVYIDPPWGQDYKKYAQMRLTLPGVAPICLEEIITTVPVKYFVVKLPANYDLAHFESIVGRSYTFIWQKSYPRPNTHVIIILARINHPSATAQVV